jgi:hypothetical protein
MQRRNQTKTAYLSAGAPSAACRVLIVEDEWFLANDLQTALKSVGADVVALVGDIDDELVDNWCQRGRYQLSDIF